MKRNRLPEEVLQCSFQFKIPQKPLTHSTNNLRKTFSSLKKMKAQDPLQLYFEKFRGNLKLLIIIFLKNKEYFLASYAANYLINFQ